MGASISKEARTLPCPAANIPPELLASPIEPRLKRRGGKQDRHTSPPSVLRCSNDEQNEKKILQYQKRILLQKLERRRARRWGRPSKGRAKRGRRRLERERRAWCGMWSMGRAKRSRGRRRRGRRQIARKCRLRSRKGHRTEWKECTTDKGQKFYYNKVTKQSAWIIPAGLSYNGGMSHPYGSIQHGGTSGAVVTPLKVQSTTPMAASTSSIPVASAARSPPSCEPGEADVYSQAASNLGQEILKMGGGTWDRNMIAFDMAVSALRAAYQNSGQAAPVPPIQPTGGASAAPKASHMDLSPQYQDDKNFVKDEVKSGKRAGDSTQWKEFTTAEGRKYYYDKVKNQYKWTIPGAPAAAGLSYSGGASANDARSKALAMFEDDERFNAVERNKERENVLENYFSERLNKRIAKAEKLHKLLRESYRGFLESCDFIKANTKWGEIQERLENDFRCSQLDKIDRLRVFREYIQDLKKKGVDQRKINKVAIELADSGTKEVSESGRNSSELEELPPRMVKEVMNLTEEQRVDKSEVKHEKKQDPKEDEKSIQVTFRFLHGQSIPAEVKEEDTLKSVLFKLDAPVYRDVYYVCEGKILCEDQRLSETSIGNGSEILVMARLRGGSNGSGGGGGGSNGSGGGGGGSNGSGGSGGGSSGIRKTTLKDYINQQKTKEWIEAVEIPETLHVRNEDSFVVMLGIDGAQSLRLILECFERRWKRNRCFRGLFEDKDIFHYHELGVIEIECEDDELDDAGFKGDVLAIERLVLQEYFKYDHIGVGSLYPMHVTELGKELTQNACVDGYSANEDNRSLIHNSPATMSFEKRIQIYNAINRYWKPLVGQQSVDFANVIDPGLKMGSPVHAITWRNKITLSSTVLMGRLYYTKKRGYTDSYMDLMEFSRCVFEHGPTANVNLKQCEAALYLLHKELFQHFQRKILTVYKENPIAPLLPTDPSTIPPIPRYAGHPNQSIEPIPVPGPRRLASVYVPSIQRKNYYDVKLIYSKT